MPGNFGKTACPTKNVFVDILKTVLVVDLTFWFLVSSITRCRIYNKVV